MVNKTHLVAFLDVRGLAAGTSLADYAARLFASHVPMGPGDAAGGFEHFRCVTLPLADHEAVLARLPAAVVARLKVQEGCLLEQITMMGRVPDGETLEAAYCTVLAGAFGVCPPGTVVAVRRTNVATLAFLIPHLRVDPATGTLSEVANPLDAPAPAPQGPGFVLQTASFAGDSANTEKWVQTALSTANVLSMALPPPFGQVVPGILTFLQGSLSGIFGEPGPDPFAKLYDKLKKDKIAEWMTDARTLVEHINRQTDIMAKNPPTAQQALTDIQWYPSLATSITPGHSRLYTELFDFQNLEGFIENQDAFFGLMTCVTVYLFGVKWGLYLKAFAAGKYFEDNDAARYHELNQEWRSDYTGFLEDILGGQSYQGWVPRVNNLVDERIKHRLGKISEVQRHDEDYMSYADPTAATRVEIHEWRWKDDGEPNPAQYGGWHSYADERPSKGDPTDHRDDADRERNAHYAKVERQQIELYANLRKLTTTWVDSINQWNSHLPPGRPASGPAVAAASFQQPVPPESVWASHQGSTVAYAVAYYNKPEIANDLGKPQPALISKWSVPVPVQGAHPQLVNVPVDDLKMALGRHIYRKFIPAEGTGALQPKLIGVIQDNTTTTYRDFH